MKRVVAVIVLCFISSFILCGCEHQTSFNVSNSISDTISFNLEPGWKVIDFSVDYESKKVTFNLGRIED